MQACVVSNILLSARVVGVDVNSHGNQAILANLLMRCTDVMKILRSCINADPVVPKANFLRVSCAVIHASLLFLLLIEHFGRALTKP